MTSQNVRESLLTRLFNSATRWPIISQALSRKSPTGIDVTRHDTFCVRGDANIWDVVTGTESRYKVSQPSPPNSLSSLSTSVGAQAKDSKTCPALDHIYCSFDLRAFSLRLRRRVTSRQSLRIVSLSNEIDADQTRSSTNHSTCVYQQWPPPVHSSSVPLWGLKHRTLCEWKAK